MVELLFQPGASMGVGSLPHRDATAAAEFAWTRTTIPTMPTLPRRSPSEAMIAQALAGIDGVSFGQYGGINIDVAALQANCVVRTDLSDDAFVGYRTFLDAAGDRRSTTVVKWQFVGPVTLGLALIRSGVSADIAFDLALRAVRSHVKALEEIVHVALPNARQIIVIDEPSHAEAFDGDYALTPDTVVDLMSGALASISRHNISGLHSCANSDWGALFATGASLLSVPVATGAAVESVVAHASRISEHFAMGGGIAWGAIRTDGPTPVSSERPWKSLTELWCQLVAHGVDAMTLRRQSIVTPVCGLGMHSEPVADKVMSLLGELTGKIADQALASRLTLGS